MTNVTIRTAAPIVAMFAVIVGFCCSCSHSSPTRERVAGDGSTLSAQAWRLRDRGAPADSFIKLQLQAVDELRRGESPDDAVTVLEQMGFFYYIKGDMRKALAFYHEAADSLATQAVADRSEGAIQLFGDIALLYDRIGITDEAFRWNDSAVAESKRHGDAMLSDIYRFRAGFYHGQDSISMALHCYDLALAAIDRGKVSADKKHLRSVINSEHAYLLLEAFKSNPDSVNRAVRLLEESIRNCEPEHDISSMELSLGIGYCLQGKPERGLPIMERVAADLRRQDDLEMFHYAVASLVDTYTHLGMWDEVGKIFPEYMNAADSLNNLKKQDFIIGASVRYDAERKEHDNEMLRIRLKAAREHTMWVVMLTSLIFLAVTLAVTVLYRRYRLMMRRRELTQCRLNRLTGEHSEALGRLQSLEHDISAGRNSNNMLLSTPQLITGEKQGAFRRAFAALYPDVIPAIKAKAPALTHNDELLCMLIYLRHTTEEISTFLGISRASVNSARYRLRQKFNLAKAEDLDAFIASFASIVL